MKQSQRTKNRLREHADHDWQLIQEGRMKFINEFEPALLFDCPCGWVGWIPKEELI